MDLNYARPGDVHYAVVYKNRPRYKGMDAYLVNTDGGVSGSINNAMRMSLDEAIDVSYKFPVYDTGHLVAQVVPVTTEVQTRVGTPI